MADLPVHAIKEGQMSVTTKDELAKQVAERTGLDASQAKARGRCDDRRDHRTARRRQRG